MIVAAGVFAGALLLGLVIGASPLLAVAIAVVIGVPLLLLAAFGRSDEYADGGESGRVRREGGGASAAAGNAGEDASSRPLPASPDGPSRAA